MPTSPAQHRHTSGLYYNKSQLYRGPKECQALTNAIASTAPNQEENARAHLMLLGILAITNSIELPSTNFPRISKTTDENSRSDYIERRHFPVHSIVTPIDDSQQKAIDFGSKNSSDIVKGVEICLSKPHVHNGTPRAVYTSHEDHLKQSRRKRKSESTRALRVSPALPRAPLQSLPRLLEPRIEHMRSDAQTWFSSALDWLARCRDPFVFPAASAHEATRLEGTVAATQHPEWRTWEISGLAEKSRLLHRTMNFLIEQGHVLREDVDQLEHRLASLSLGGSIYLHQFKEAFRSQRDKRTSQTSFDDAIKKHIELNCAFEDLILNKDGLDEGEILLFEAQHQDNPFFYDLWGDRGDTELSPEEAGIADGLNYVTWILTLGLKPLVSSQIAHAYRREYHLRRGDDICAERYKRLAVVDGLTSVDAEAPNPNVLTGGGIKKPRRTTFKNLTKSLETLRINPYEPGATYIATNRKTGVKHALILRRKSDGHNQHRSRSLEITRRSDGEYFEIDPENPLHEPRRIILGPDDATYRYADSMPDEVYSRGLTNLHRDRKSFVIIEGKQCELHWDHRNSHFEIVAEMPESRDKIYLPVYVEPLSKTWHLANHNGKPVFSINQKSDLDRYAVAITDSQRFSLIDDHRISGNLYTVRDSATAENSWIGAEVGGRLVPVRQIDSTAPNVGYEVYDLANPQRRGNRLEWDGARWIFELPTSDHISDKVVARLPNLTRYPPVDAGTLSMPGEMGLSRSVEGRNYIEVRGRYLEVKSLGKTGQRYYLSGSDDQKIILRYENGQFRSETLAERLALMRANRQRPASKPEHELMTRLGWTRDEASALLSRYDFSTDPVAGKQFAREYASTKAEPEWAAQYKAGESNNYLIMQTAGDPRSQLALFPEYPDELLVRSGPSEQQFKSAFDQLEADEKLAVRTWTAAGGEIRKTFSDGSPNMDERYIPPFNYKLNQKLSRNVHLDPDEIVMANNLQSALEKLPGQPGSYLRISEYPSIDACPWGTQISEGDIVTNHPNFMSVSDSKEYALTTLAEGGVSGNAQVYVFFKIDKTAPRGLWDGVASLEPENELLFPPDRYFRVKGISVATATSDAAAAKHRVGVLLEQVDAQIYSAKNIHTGEELLGEGTVSAEHHLARQWNWTSQKARAFLDQYDLSTSQKRMLAIQTTKSGKVPEWAAIYRRDITFSEAYDELHDLIDSRPAEYRSQMLQDIASELKLYNYKKIHGEISFFDWYAIREFSKGNYGETLSRFAEKNPNDSLVKRIDHALAKLSRNELDHGIERDNTVGHLEFPFDDDDSHSNNVAGKTVYRGEIRSLESLRNYQIGREISFSEYTGGGNRELWIGEVRDHLQSELRDGEVTVFYEIERTTPAHGAYVARLSGDAFSEIIFPRDSRFVISRAYYDEPLRRYYITMRTAGYADPRAGRP